MCIFLDFNKRITEQLSAFTAPSRNPGAKTMFRCNAHHTVIPMLDRWRSTNCDVRIIMRPEHGVGWCNHLGANMPQASSLTTKQSAQIATITIQTIDPGGLQQLNVILEQSLSCMDHKSVTLHYSVCTWLWKYNSRWKFLHGSVRSWQVKPSCSRHQLKYSDDLILACLRHSMPPKISYTFDQQNVVKVVVCWDDARDILQLSVIG
jgi:hypothetical protein